MRKLLYHRGVDDSEGTYITDYCQFILCAILSALLLIIIIRSRQKHACSVKASSYSVLLLLASLSLMSIFGGLTHQYLQEVEPYVTWHDNWTWLIIWRAGASFAAVLCFSFLLLGYSLLLEQNVLSVRRRLNIILSILSVLFSLAVFTFSLLSIKREVDPWSIKKILMITYACALFAAICSTITTCKSFCQKNEDERKSTFLHSDADSKKYIIHQQGVDEFSNDPMLSHDKPESPGPNKHLSLFCLATWIFVLSGAIQVTLGKIGCADHDEDEVYPCPLPKSFNHNALLHVMIMADAVIFFIAEYLAVKMRLKRIKGSLEERCS